MIPVADDLPLGSKRGERIGLFRAASLFVSDNGLDWTKVSHIASNDDGEPGLHFRPDGRAQVVSRNGRAASMPSPTRANRPFSNGKRSRSIKRFTRRR